MVNGRSETDYQRDQTEREREGGEQREREGVGEIPGREHRKLSRVSWYKRKKEKKIYGWR